MHFPWPEGAEDLTVLDTEQTYAAVRELGSDAHLERVIPSLTDFDVAMFAVTSASFLHGAHGVGRQLATLRRLTGLPTVSTTSAFQHAVQHSGLTSVALASVYDPSASDHFIDRLAEVGATTISRVDADASSDRELATWSSDQIASLVRRMRARTTLRLWSCPRPLCTPPPSPTCSIRRPVVRYLLPPK